VGIVTATVEVMQSVQFVCDSVSVCVQAYCKSDGPISLKLGANGYHRKN